MHVSPYFELVVHVLRALLMGRQNPTQRDTRLLPTRNRGILSKLSHLTADNVKQIGLKLSHKGLSSPKTST